MGVHAIYSHLGSEVTAQAGPVSLRVYPRPEKQKTPRQMEKAARKALEKAEKKALKQEKKKEKKAGNVQEKKKLPLGGKIAFFKELLGIGLHALGCIRRKLIMKDLVLSLTLAGQGSDAAESAILYGKAWAAVGALTPVLENTFQIRNRDIQVGIDFLSEEHALYAEATVLLRIGDVLWIALYHGIRALIVLLIQKQKGRIKHGTSHQ